LFLLCFAGYASAQQKGFKKKFSALDTNLVKINEKATLDKYNKMLFDIRNSMRPPEDSVSPGNDTKWQLLAFDGSWNTEYATGQSEHLPESGTYKVTKETVVMSTKEIFDLFELKEDEIRKKDYPLRYTPIIYGRNAHYNAEWTPILTNRKYLMLRFVHSYPDGNVTSWHHELTYYFRVVN
jgi:hypothetical protein